MALRNFSSRASSLPATIRVMVLRLMAVRKSSAGRAFDSSCPISPTCSSKARFDSSKIASESRASQGVSCTGHSSIRQQVGPTKLRIHSLDHGKYHMTGLKQVTKPIIKKQDIRNAIQELQTIPSGTSHIGKVFRREDQIVPPPVPNEKGLSCHSRIYVHALYQSSFLHQTQESIETHLSVSPAHSIRDGVGDAPARLYQLKGPGFRVLRDGTKYP